MVDAKVFLLACLTRRNKDPDFDKAMRLWFSQYQPDEIRKINNSPTVQ